MRLPITWVLHIDWLLFDLATLTLQLFIYTCDLWTLPHNVILRKCLWWHADNVLIIVSFHLSGKTPHIPKILSLHIIPQHTLGWTGTKITIDTWILHLYVIQMMTLHNANSFYLLMDGDPFPGRVKPPPKLRFVHITHVNRGLEWLHIKSIFWDFLLQQELHEKIELLDEIVFGWRHLPTINSLIYHPRRGIVLCEQKRKG